MRTAAVAFTFLLSTLVAAGQDTPTVTRDDLPPSSILAEELNSFERVRSDMANWSDVELAAFRETTARAKADCSRIERTPHEGEEALALARLCAVGLDWDGTYSAARWYTRASAPAEEATHLAVGFALLVRADLNLQATARSLGDLKEMQERVPFGEDTDSVFEYAIGVLEVMRPEDAAQVVLIRQASLLDAVGGKNKTMPSGKAEAEAWHALAVLHCAGNTAGEEAQKTLLLNVIASRTEPLPLMDRYSAQRGRTLYEWLGRRAPHVDVVRSTDLHHHAAVKQEASLWVIERASAPDVSAISLGVDSLRSHLTPEEDAKLVLIESPADTTSRKPAGTPPVHADYTRNELLDTFPEDSGPLFVVLDGAGRVQWCGVGTATWLNPQQQAAVLLTRVAAREHPAE